VVRRLLGLRKVGHTGTLDPLATGLLPLLVGDATRLSAHLSEDDKEYLATAQLGTTTDTLDADGRVLVTRPLPSEAILDVAHLTPLFSSFLGAQAQAVPRFSAVKVQGRTLHARARAGEEPDAVPPRQITVYALDLLTIDPPRLTLRVRCSKGTYVRQIVSDLGEALGCGAHVSALRRTRVGSLGVEEATPLAALEADPAAALARLVPLAAWLGRTLPSVLCDSEAAARTRMGQHLPWSCFGSPPLPPGARFALYCGEEVVAVAEVRSPHPEDAGPCYRLLRVFSASTRRNGMGCSSA